MLSSARRPPHPARRMVVFTSVLGAIVFDALRLAGATTSIGDSCVCAGGVLRPRRVEDVACRCGWMRDLRCVLTRFLWARYAACHWRYTRVASLRV
ncbi:hypothetical protein C8J57DRAFT_1393419, partial [Mycena rebaudengoi]